MCVGGGETTDTRYHHNDIIRLFRTIMSLDDNMTSGKYESGMAVKVGKKIEIGTST